jgi:hypothetical protein
MALKFPVPKANLYVKVLKKICRFIRIPLIKLKGVSLKTFQDSAYKIFACCLHFSLE